MNLEWSEKREEHLSKYGPVSNSDEKTRHCWALYSWVLFVLLKENHIKLKPGLKSKVETGAKWKFKDSGNMNDIFLETYYCYKSLLLLRCILIRSIS